MEKDPMGRAQHRISENKLTAEEAAVQDRGNLQNEKDEVEYLLMLLDTLWYSRGIQRQENGNS